MKSTDEFVVGKHGIGYVDSDLKKYLSGISFDIQKSPPTFQSLARYMRDSEIESELKVGSCTLGDVLAIIESNDPIFKDGNWNIFYLPQCVVRVCWDAGYGAWFVSAWDRGVDVWYAGDRVFSPASDRMLAPSVAFDLALESLNSRLKKVEALINPALLQ